MWNAECWQVNQHQHVIAGINLCAKTFKSCVGSADSSTRDQPEPSTTLYIAERVLACFACLCHHPFHWLRLLTLALSIGPCQCLYIFVSRWPSACNLQVTWIRKYRSQQRFSRILSLALYSGSSIGARAALSNYVFFQFNSYQIECFFEAMGLHRTLDLNSNPMDSTHSRIISNER